MASPAELVPFELTDPELSVERAPPGATELFRSLYIAVGGPYHWRDRLALGDGELAAQLTRPNVALWILRHRGEPAGFCELCRHDDGGVEIVYFGIVDRYFGRGYGKHFLTRAVREAWQLGADRVWLHTCTLDSPAALPNYLARGFRPFRTETYETEIPDRAGA
jgi:GNAT superfamily N-acetyltransferase